MSQDIALIGVFSNLEWQEKIQKYLNQNPDSIYWLPWGSRQKNLKNLLHHLVIKKEWTETSKPDYQIYQSADKHTTLKLFHHNSKTQGGDGKIHYRFDIMYCVLGDAAFQPKRPISHPLISQYSSTWLGIVGCKTVRVLGEFLDFAADFDSINYKSGQKQQVNERTDGINLYYDFLIVQSFKHGKKNPCSCPQCI